MIAAVLFSLLFIIVLAGIFLFIFQIFIPALKAQKIHFDRPLFSESEIRVKPSPIEEYHNANGKVALVLCSPNKDCGEKRFVYDGPKSCHLFLSQCDTQYDCKFSCIGFGDCTHGCSRHAITIVNNTAVVNELCNGCGKCLDYCPKGIIKLVPAATKKYILCSTSLNDKNSCSMNMVESILDNKKSNFKFWERWYTLNKR